MTAGHCAVASDLVTAHVFAQMAATVEVVWSPQIAAEMRTE